MVPAEPLDWLAQCWLPGYVAGTSSPQTSGARSLSYFDRALPLLAYGWNRWESTLFFADSVLKCVQKFQAYRRRLFQWIRAAIFGLQSIYWVSWRFHGCCVDLEASKVSKFAKSSRCQLSQPDFCSSYYFRKRAVNFQSSAFIVVANCAQKLGLPLDFYSFATGVSLVLPLYSSLDSPATTSSFLLYPYWWLAKLYLVQAAYLGFTNTLSYRRTSFGWVKTANLTSLTV